MVSFLGSSFFDLTNFLSLLICYNRVKIQLVFSVNFMEVTYLCRNYVSIVNPAIDISEGLLYGCGVEERLARKRKCSLWCEYLLVN